MRIHGQEARDILVRPAPCDWFYPWGGVLQWRLMPARLWAGVVDGLVHGLAQKPSAFPVLNPLPGISSPPPDTPAYEDFLDVFENNLRKIPVDRILIGREMAIEQAQFIAEAPKLFCGRERHTFFDVLLVCKNGEKQLSRFAAGLSGADASVDATRFGSVLGTGSRRNN